MSNIIDVSDAPTNPLLLPPEKELSSEEEMTPAEIERHERFLKAREEGMRRAREGIRNTGRQPQRRPQPSRFQLGYAEEMLPARSAGPMKLLGRGPQRAMQSLGMRHYGVAQAASHQASSSLSSQPLEARPLTQASSSRGSSEEEGSMSSTKRAVALYAPRDEAEEEEVKQERLHVLKRLHDWLEDANEEVREVVLPIIKLPIVELLLLDVYHESLSTQRDTRMLVSRFHTKMILLTLCRWIEKSGVVASNELHDGYKKHLEQVNLRRNLGEDVSPEELRVQSWLERRMSEETFQQEGMTLVIQQCEGIKHTGMVAYDTDNLGGAMANWKKADEALRRFKHLYEYAYYNDRIQDLHAAILKNRALGCLRLYRWDDALDCASCAIEINDVDHKAWFRKACALESLGRISEAGDCLFRVQQIAADRPDRDKIMKEVIAKKESLRALTWKERPAINNNDEASSMKSLPNLPSEPLVKIPSPSKALLQPEVAERTIHTFDFYERRRISREEARHLLQDLRTAYDDIEFQRQVLKLSREVHRDKVKFLSRLKPLALRLQRPVLEAWDFEASDRGVQEMSLALADHTRGARADPEIMQEAADTARTLYGSMFDVVFASPTGPSPPRREQPSSENQSDSDDDMPPALIDG